MPPRRTPPDASDHDLLIAIRERLDVLHTSVRENQTAINLRLESLGREKANLSDLDPLRRQIETVQEASKEQETKIGDVSRKVAIGVGILATLQVVIPIAITLLLRSLGK